jgi:hypothetical protein
MRQLAFLLFVLPFIAQAQTDMFGDEKVKKTDQEVYVEGAEEEAKILIIPFEKNLFNCDMMRDLTTVNEMSANQIYHRLRNEIQLSLQAALKDSMETALFLNTDSINKDDLINFYAVMGYDYVPIPVEKEEDKKGKKKKVEQPKERQVGVRNGQVVAERDLVERYMKTVLKDNAILNKFYSNYGINRFLFINQMDVTMDLSDPETAFVDPKRLAAIHYTILDNDGKELTGGLASKHFPGTESRLNYIIGTTFYALSAEVLGKLIQKEKEDEEKSEKENQKSKTKVEK